MSNRPSRGLTNANSIVIVCEGTDTEYNYFDELCRKDVVKQRFDEIKVVPHPAEMIKQRNPKRPRKGCMLPDGAKFHYHIKYEDDIYNYNQYRAQPTRYVREAYLFKTEDGYGEAWAVFDHDDFPNHREAFEYADSCGVNIAFSSRCFEEWLLLHFERNTTAFTKSGCSIATNADSMQCGTGINSGDCHGNICIAGRLREQRYIADYSKDKKGLYDTYTAPRFPLCFINAAWSRSLSQDVVYNRNPYTNVDNLICRLTGTHNDFVWLPLNEPWNVGGAAIVITRDIDNVYFRNIASRGWLLKRVLWLDTNGEDIGENQIQQVLRNTDNEAYSVKKQNNAYYCVIEDTGKKYVFEL